MNKAFYRKVAYCAAIAVLLVPLSWLGQPPAGAEGKGGKLAELRQQHGLSQAQLGEIDPASETMRLATLGMNGVAANYLWHKAIHYQKVKDWSNFMASVNQIIKLQPNFIKVWEFQAHNVSYNTSVEFDDYRYRYAWVKRGIEFLIDGIRYNRDEPRLLSYTGHFFGQKIGRADEAKQFRRMFAQDRDFHDEFRHVVEVDEAIGQSGYPDNWLVSRLWYLQAQRAVDAGRPLRGESELIFHSHPPKSRINYAIFNEQDGYHGERARRDWARALEEWSQDYASREIPTSWGHTLRLNEKESFLAKAAEVRRELEQVAGVTFQQVENEKRAALSPEAQAALDTPVEQRTPDQHQLHFDASFKIQVKPEEVADRAPSERRREAQRLAALIADLELYADRIGRYREIVNYDYWKTRCEVEMTELADHARQLVHQANDKFQKAQLTRSVAGEPGAKEVYEEAWQAWARLFEQYPGLKDDLMAEELVDSIRNYIEVLNQLDEKLPDDFVLADILERHDHDYFQQREAARRAAQRLPGQPAPGDASTAPATAEEGAEEAATDAPAEPRPPMPPEDKGDAPADEAS